MRGTSRQKQREDRGRPRSLPQTGACGIFFARDLRFEHGLRTYTGGGVGGSGRKRPEAAGSGSGG